MPQTKKLNFKIGNKTINKSSKTFLISEIGINHEGSLLKCIKMIAESKKAGADAVKLQTVKAENNYLRSTKSFKEFKKTDFSDEELFKIVNFSKKNKLIFLSTPGTFNEVDQLINLKVDGIKISSGSMTNYPLISYAAKTKSIIISTVWAIMTKLGRQFLLVNQIKILQF